MCNKNVNGWHDHSVPSYVTYGHIKQRKQEQAQNGFKIANCKSRFKDCLHQSKKVFRFLK